MSIYKDIKITEKLAKQEKDDQVVNQNNLVENKKHRMHIKTES